MKKKSRGAKHKAVSPLSGRDRSVADRQSAFSLFGAGRVTEALAVAERLLQTNRDDPFLLNLAAVCHGMEGDAEVAFSLWRHALRVAPDYADACCNMANVLRDQGRFAEAEGCYRQTLGIHPGHIEARNNLGVLLQRLGRHAEAEAMYLQIIALRPDLADVYFNLGNLYRESKRPDAAEQAYRKALLQNPRQVDVCNNLGLLYQESGRVAEAEACYRRALAVNPKHGDALYNLANLFKDSKRCQEAEKGYRQVLRLHPEHVLTCNNLGILLHQMEKHAEAEGCYRQALRLAPDFADAGWNLALHYLSLGDFPQGWPLYEYRYHPSMKKRNTVPPDVTIPMWRGENVQGKSMLIVAEQGLGDQIQFCRYATMLKASGARRITLTCDAALRLLFQSLEGVDAVVEKGASFGEDHDFWTFYLSIPQYMRTTVATIPARIPYLHPGMDRVAHWRSLLPVDGFKVGLVWRGSPVNANDANRSLPGLEVLAPLWEVPGVTFISLQKGDGEEQAKTPPVGQPLRHYGPLLHDFADTAALVVQLDLVISIDSAVAHLAGAVGQRCWVLLPRWGTDWRWLKGRSDSPWYPDGMRLFRQTRFDDWSRVVQRMARELADWVGERERNASVHSTNGKPKHG
ncbi:MAG: tetratricopeptide repeat protein [Magnetococcales bacterium]|nr:tetratricopeptide repeat protein [Magnetococcales bacterium]